MEKHEVWRSNCRNASRYQGLRKPRCGCISCALQYGFRSHELEVVPTPEEQRIVDAAVAYVTVGSEPGLSDSQVASESVRRNIMLEQAVEDFLG